ncbi:hypothetical protein L6452_42972 [Arctium lappa]|uniref:Uncharacterized protein n=1 Tax=Arctium lappa TaxID=4217 RepID=A0ACB8XJZ2_ARCLA|nr:hypothetical protein L6452_42972 [Arctium lappa]
MQPDKVRGIKEAQQTQQNNFELFAEIEKKNFHSNDDGRGETWVNLESNKFQDKVVQIQGAGSKEIQELVNRIGPVETVGLDNSDGEKRNYNSVEEMPLNEVAQVVKPISPEVAQGGLKINQSREGTHNLISSEGTVSNEYGRRCNDWNSKKLRKGLNSTWVLCEADRAAAVRRHGGVCSKVWWYRVGVAGLMIDQQQISRGWLSLVGECNKERFLYWSNDALYAGESEAAQGSVSCLVLVCLRGCSR